jgi:type IV secretion system protein VirD4
MPLQIRRYLLKCSQMAVLSVWQDLAQAEALYEKGFNSFLGNAGVVQAFAPQELLTSDYLSRMTGQTTKYVSSRGESLNPSPGQPTGFSVSRSQNVNSIAMPLMLPHQVRAMGEGYTLVFSHKADGPLRVYVPWPGNVRHLQHVMSLDTANRA